jgi:predicted permease
MRNWTREIADAFARAGHDPDIEIVEELAQHADSAYATMRADGVSAEEAGESVARQIDVWTREAPSLTRRALRRAPAAPPSDGGRLWTRGIVQDLRYAMRLLRRQAGFSLLVIGTMTAGIAATTLLFSVTYGVLMKPLPWPDADRLVLLEETRGGNRPRFNSFSNAAYLAWREQPATIEEIAAWSPRQLTLTGVGEPTRIRAVASTASLFRTLAVHPLAGSLFEDADETSQRGDVVVLSERLWRERFGGDAAALGRTIELEGRPHRIIGVLPDRAAYPDRDTLAWVPFRVNPTTGGLMSMFEAIARLRPGTAVAQAGDEATARALAAPAPPNLEMTVRAIFGASGAVRVSATPLREALTSDVRRPLIVLLIAVGLLFAAATANVASLQLTRSMTRSREMAIRGALGAGSVRVTRQLVIENGVLALGGGAAGVAVAAALHRLLPSLLPPDFPRLPDLAFDLPVALFALVVSSLAGVAVGLVPARRARQLDLVRALSEDGAGSSGLAGARTARLRAIIMAGQVAVACVLLVGASLLGRSFIALVTADRGFDPSNVLIARVQLPSFAYPDHRRAQLIDAIVERLRAIPGVAAASYSDGPPLGIYGGTAFMLDDRRVTAASRTVTPGYLAAMGIRILEGRDFTADDVATSRPVFIVNRSFAQRYLGPRPVGQRVRGWVREGRDHWEIIAVVDDVRHRGVTEPPELEIYRYRERDDLRVSTSPTVIVRTSGDPGALAPTFRAIVQQQDASVVIDSIGTMEDRVLASLAKPRLYAILLGGFALFALLVAGVGLLGTLSFAVAQRSREFAVRAAVGARGVDLVRLVVRQALVVGLAGVCGGLAAAVMASRALATLLYGVPPSDPITFAAVPVALLVLTIAASLAPALRAARIDPLRVLRGSV